MGAGLTAVVVVWVIVALAVGLAVEAPPQPAIAIAASTGALSRPTRIRWGVIVGIGGAFLVGGGVVWERPGK